VDAQLLNTAVMVLAIRCHRGPSGASCRQALLLAAQRLDQGFGITLRNREARAKGLSTPHAGFVRCCHVVRGPERCPADPHQPGPAMARMVGPGNGYRHGCSRIRGPLFWTMRPLRLHHRFSESSLAPIPLREVQDTFSLVLAAWLGEVVGYHRKVCEPPLQPPQRHSATTETTPSSKT